MAKKLLVIADSPTCNTGFGNVTRNVLGNIKGFDISIIAVNYYGDPHVFQNTYRLYNPAIGGDVYGMGRIQEVLQKESPDLVWILNDIWLCVEYVRVIRQHNKKVPIVIYTPVDSENIKPDFVLPLMHDPLTTLITYTHFAKDQLVAAGYTKSIDVIPHGIDTTHFHPMDQKDARAMLLKGISLDTPNPFIVLYVARNQPRKQIDLFLWIMAEWIKRYDRKDVYVNYHGAVRDLGIDVEQWAYKLGIDNRLILTAKNVDPGIGIPIDKLKVIYNSADVYFHTCAVEGWGMPLHEAMACGVPAIVPDYSALSEWPTLRKTRDSVQYVPVSNVPTLNPNGINTIHYTVDVEKAIETLESLYQDSARRRELSELGHAVATDAQYSWATIGESFLNIFTKATQNIIVNGDVLRVWKS